MTPSTGDLGPSALDQLDYTYDPNGNSTTSKLVSSPPANQVQYASQYVDPSTGLELMGARQYDPSQAAFTATDPVTTGAGQPAVSE